MKTYYLALLLFFSVAANAQTVNIDFSLGQMVPLSGYVNLTGIAGLGSQYLFKNSGFVIDDNLLYMQTSSEYPTNFLSSIFMLNVFLGYNLTHKSNTVVVMPEIGVFGMSYFSLNFTNPYYNYGPAISLYMAYKISKKAYLGIDAARANGIEPANVSDYFYFVSIKNYLQLTLKYTRTF
jgi:hypothetical protein